MTLETGYLTGQLGAGGYQATHRGTPRYVGQRMTPNFEKKEGLRFGPFVPAAYLPSQRLEPIDYVHFVITAGQPVALDSRGYAVPAGLKKALALGGANGPQYTQADIMAGVKNAAGVVPAVGERVIASMITEGITIGAVVGVASYDVYQLAGSDPTNPATYKFHNYNRQTGVAVLTDYLLEFPIEPFQRIDHKIETTIASASSSFDLAHSTVVPHSVQLRVNGGRDVDFVFGNGTGAGGVDELNWADANHLKVGDVVVVTYQYEVTGTYNAPWAGIATWRGAVKHGDFVTFDKDSAWVAYTPAAIGDTTAANQAAAISAAIAKSLSIVGQVTLVDYAFPKQFLDRVKTAYDDRLTGPIVDGRTGTTSKLDKMPGSATDGAPHNVFYAGGDTKTGIVRFNMNIK